MNIVSNTISPNKICPNVLSTSSANYSKSLENRNIIVINFLSENTNMWRMVSELLRSDQKCTSIQTEDVGRQFVGIKCVY